MEGLFSVKSDVFSFGVILLEIINGKRNTGFYITELAPTLLAYVIILNKHLISSIILLLVHIRKSTIVGKDYLIIFFC